LLDPARGFYQVETEEEKAQEAFYRIHRHIKIINKRSLTFIQPSITIPLGSQKN
jgi:hypothetical protein